MMPEADITVGFAGMTHLGINSAVAAADHGFAVVGFDPDARLIESLSNRRFPIHEPGLEALASKNAARVRFTSDPSALAGLDLCYVASDVPTDDEGHSDLGPI